MGSIVLIGAYGGIGTALTEMLATAGQRLVLCGRDGEKAARLAATFGQVGCALDASNEADMATFAQTFVERYGPPRAVVNLAGSIVLKPLERTTVADLQDCFQTNVLTAFLTVKAFAPLLAQQAGGGSIVLMSSVAARIGLANHEAIAAAKGAVEGLVLAAAASYATRGVRINAVAPALVETPLSARPISSEEARKASALMHPLGRIGEPQDVASLLQWLLEPRQTWMTGQVVSLDGGMSTLKTRR